LTFSSTCALEYSQKSFVEEFTSRITEYDEIPEVAEITAVCTENAAKLVYEQLEVVRKIKYKVTEGQANRYELVYKDHKHFVDVDSSSCSCAFQKTFGLPCRHLFVLRIHLSPTVFEKAMDGLYHIRLAFLPLTVIMQLVSHW